MSAPPNFSQLARATWAVLGVYWVILAVMTHTPAQRMPNVQIKDKILHVAAYAILGALAYAAMWFSWPTKKWRAWAALPLGLAWATIDELTQPFSGRSCELMDWVADAAGLLLAIVALSVVRQWAVGRTKNA